MKSSSVKLPLKALLAPSRGLPTLESKDTAAEQLTANQVFDFAYANLYQLNKENSYKPGTSNHLIDLPNHPSSYGANFISNSQNLILLNPAADSRDQDKENHLGAQPLVQSLKAINELNKITKNKNIQTTFLLPLLETETPEPNPLLAPQARMHWTLLLIVHNEVHFIDPSQASLYALNSLKEILKENGFSFKSFNQSYLSWLDPNDRNNSGRYVGELSKKVAETFYNFRIKDPLNHLKTQLLKPHLKPHQRNLIATTNLCATDIIIASNATVRKKRGEPTFKSLLSREDLHKAGEKTANAALTHPNFFTAGKGGLHQLKIDLANLKNMTLKTTKPSDREIAYLDIPSLAKMLGCEENIAENVAEAYNARLIELIPNILSSGISSHASRDIFLGVAKPEVRIWLSDHVKSSDLNNIVFKVTYANFTLLNKDKHKPVGQWDGPLEATFAMTEIEGKWGFQLKAIRTENLELQRILNGISISETYLALHYCGEAQAEILQQLASAPLPIQAPPSYKEAIQPVIKKEEKFEYPSLSLQPGLQPGCSESDKPLQIDFPNTTPYYPSYPEDDDVDEKGVPYSQPKMIPMTQSTAIPSPSPLPNTNNRFNLATAAIPGIDDLPQLLEQARQEERSKYQGIEVELAKLREKFGDQKNDSQELIEEINRLRQQVMEMADKQEEANITVTNKSEQLESFIDISSKLRTELSTLKLEATHSATVAKQLSEEKEELSKALELLKIEKERLDLLSKQQRQWLQEAKENNGEISLHHAQALEEIETDKLSITRLESSILQLTTERNIAREENQGQEALLNHRANTILTLNRRVIGLEQSITELHRQLNTAVLNQNEVLAGWIAAQVNNANLRVNIQEHRAIPLPLNTPWWQYALAATALILGLAACATGAGALLGITLLHTALSFSGALGLLAAGASTVLFSSIYTGYSASCDRSAEANHAAAVQNANANLPAAPQQVAAAVVGMYRPLPAVPPVNNFMFRQQNNPPEVQPVNQAAPRFGLGGGND